MEETRKPMFGHALNWGLIGLLVMVILTLVIYFLGVVQNSIVGLISFAIYIGVLYFGMKTYRDSMPGVHLGYGRALVLGIFIGVFVAVGSAVYNFVFFKFIAPDYHATLIEQANLRVIEMDLPAATEAAALESQAKFMTAGWMAFFSLFGTIFQGVLASLIAAIFGKGTSPSAEEIDTDID